MPNYFTYRHEDDPPDEETEEEETVLDVVERCIKELEKVREILKRENDNGNHLPFVV